MSVNKTCEHPTHNMVCGRDVFEGNMCLSHTFSLTKADRKKGCIFGEPSIGESDFNQCCKPTYDEFDYCEDHLRYFISPFAWPRCEFINFKVPVRSEGRECSLPATRDKYCKSHSIRLGLSK